MITLIIRGKSYSKIFSKITWSGTQKESSRILNAEFYSNFDLAPPEIHIGDKVEFLLDDRLLFVGTIFNRERNAEGIISKFTAYDKSIYLNKNKFAKNYNKSTPSKILGEICSELGLKIEGEPPEDKVQCTFSAFDKSGDQIIKQAYMQQSMKDKIKYSIVCSGEKIKVVTEEETVKNIEINTEYDLLSARYTESIDSMINQAIIYKTDKDKNQKETIVTNQEDKIKYGLFQNVKQHDKEIDDISSAKGLLKGVQQTGSLRIVGNPNILSGYSISVRENRSGMKGRYLIATDTHEWTNGGYTTDLTLVFK